ncbi:hypothetical protein IAU59_007497 [Kwoniella sp. CBS 9459]
MPSYCTVRVWRHGYQPESDYPTSRRLFLLSHEDFCVLGPANIDQPSKISETNLNVVSYCSKEGHNTRLIPDGTLHGVTYVKAPNWVQVSGYGDFTKINIAQGDAGGQFDSADHLPEGATLTLSQGGDPAKNWVTLISADTFCVRACTGDPKFCPTQFDEMGCFFLTSDGVGWDNVWQDCEGDDGDPPGVFDGKEYQKGDPLPSMVIPPVSNCQPGSSISNGQTAFAALTSGSGSGDKSESGGGSTSWAPVQTCVPCTEAVGSGAGPTSSAASASASDERKESTSQGDSEGDKSSASSSSSSSPGGEGGGTEQVGVTQLTTSAASATETSTSGGAEQPDAQSPPGLAKRQEDDGEGGGLKEDKNDQQDDGGGTVTSDGQCCFTTWTPTVVGGAKETGSGKASGSASGSGSGASSGSGSGSGSGSAKATGSGTSATLSGAKTAAPLSTGTGSGKVNASGSGSNGSGNGTGNGAFGRLDIGGLGDGSGLGKLSWIIGITAVGMVGGGMTFV